MTFFEIYNKLPDVKQKRAFRKKIIEATKIEPGSFYTWLNRKHVSALAQSVIAATLNIPQSELFPEKTESINV